MYGVLCTTSYILDRTSRCSALVREIVARIMNYYSVARADASVPSTPYRDCCNQTSGVITSRDRAGIMVVVVLVLTVLVVLRTPYGYSPRNTITLPSTPYSVRGTT
jgi:hypothetical protein